MERLQKVIDASSAEKLPELRTSGSRGKVNRIVKDFSSVPIQRTNSQGFPALSRESHAFNDDINASLTEKNPNLPKEISKGISYLDVVSRVRDLERKYIDLSSSLDRRVQTFIEENPQKVLRHLKVLEDKESTLWKESQQKQINFQDNIEILKASFKENNDEVNQNLITVQRRLDESEFKIATLVKALEGFNKNRNSDRMLAITSGPSEHEQKIGSLETEIRLLKEGLTQERQRRDTIFQDIMQQYQEINNYVHQNENTLLNKIRKHKEEVIEENKRSKDQQKKLEEIKLEKILNDSEYLRSLIRQVEGKMEEEINKRLKHEFENKNWMEQKISLFKQEIKSDEKELLENEKKFLQNIQESMNSLSQIVTNTREQLEANLASTQTLFNENVKSLSKTLDLLKNNVYTKLNVFDTSLKDLDQRVSDTQKSLHEHTIVINQTMDKEFTRIEKVTLKFEELMNENFKTQNDKLTMFDENNKIWRKGFEDKNLRVLTEISNALKTLKGELNKEKNDNTERLGNMRNEVESNKNAAEKLVEQLNERIKNVENRVEYKLEETFVKVSEDLKLAIDKVDQEIHKAGGTLLEKAKKDVQSNLASLDQKLKAYTDTEITKVRDELAKNNKNNVDNLKVEVQKDLQSVRLDIVDLQRQKAAEVKELQGSIKYLHDGAAEIRNESREGLRQLSEEFDGKVKLAYQNARNHASEKVKDLKDEMNKAFASHHNFVQNEMDLSKTYYEKLRREVLEKLKIEMQVDIKELLHQVEGMLDEERQTRALKDTELANGIQNVKAMLIENINTKIESTQALTRALINEEIAERARNIENLTTTFKKRMDAIEKFFKDLLSTSIEETKLELKELIRHLEIKFEEHKVWTSQQFNLIIKDVEEYIMSQTVQQYRDELFQTVQERSRTEQWTQIQDAFLTVGSKFEELDSQRREDLEVIYAKVNELNDEIDKKGKHILEVDKNVEDIQGNMYLMDDKFSNGIDDLNTKIQVKDYVNMLYDKIEAKTEKATAKQELENKLNEITNQIDLLDKRLIADEEATDLFEEKTEKNFKVAEQALLAHKTYINQLDARNYVEDMMINVNLKSIEERMTLELATIGSQVDLISEDVEAKFEIKIQSYQKRMEEDVIPHQLIKLEEKFKDAQNDAQTGHAQTKDQYQQKISEHEVKLGEHEEFIQKYSKSLTDNDGLKEDIKALIMQDIQKSLDADVQNLMEKNMQVLVEKDISKAVKPVVESEIKQLEEKIAKGGASGNSANDAEVKKELSRLKELIDKIQMDLTEKEKTNMALDKKIEALNSNITGVEKSVKTEIDKTYNSQNSNHQAVATQLTNLFDQLKTLQTKLDHK